MSDDEDWDSEFGLDQDSNQQINLSLQRKLTIGHLSKKKSSFDLMDDDSSSNNNSNNNSRSNTPINTPSKTGSNNNNNNTTTTTSSQLSPLPLPVGSRALLNTSINNYSEDGDDDDWDSHLGSPSKGLIQSRKEIEQETSDADEWDADFGNSPSIGSPLPALKILGIKADPTAKAEWDDDFVFNDNSESDTKPSVNILSRARSVPVVGASEKVSHTITELLSLIAFGSEVDSVFPIPLKDSSVKVSPLSSLKIISETEFKKKIDIQQKNIEIKEVKGNKLEISKSYFEMGMIYQQHQQQTLVAFNHFSTANKIYQEYKDDFDTPIDENNDSFELELYYHLGVSSKSMANIFNATEYLKKALETSQKDRSFLNMYYKINFELGLCYMTTETPVYSTKYFETLLRSVLFSHCTHSNSSSSNNNNNNNNSSSNLGLNLNNNHQKDCLKNEALIKEWAYIGMGCYQMAKILKQLNDIDLSVGYCKKAIYAYRKALSSTSNHSATAAATGITTPTITIINENEAITLFNEVRKQQQQIIQEADATTAKDFESDDGVDEDDDDEDWDAELGLDEENNRPVLQLAGQSPAVATTKDRMSSHYKILDSINNQNFEIVKYPKPSYLYSLTTPEGHLFLHEEALCQWLSSLIVKHLQGEDRALRVVNQRASLEELRNEFAQETTKFKKNTRKWARLNLEFCYTLHIFGYDDVCWDTIHEFFVDLRDCVLSSPVGRTTTTTGARIGSHTSTGSSNSLLNSVSLSSRQLQMEIDDKDATYHYALQMLYLASKLWTMEEDTTFKHMYQGLKNLSSVNSPLVDLVVAECYSHHLHHKKSSDDDDDDDDDDDRSSESDEEPEFRVRPGEFNSNEEEKINPLNIFLKVYQQCTIRLQQQPSLHQQQQQSSSPSTPTKQQTTNSNGVPIYKTTNSNKEYYEIGTKNAMARALVDIHFHLNGISPLTTKRLSDSFDEDVNVTSGNIDLLDANIRMKLLTDLYPEVPPTFLKAKAAYALGLNAVDSGDLVLAEKFFFECLYIIDKCKEPALGLPLVLSELAANASISYASVLLDNFKYQYAIISFDNALLNLNLRKKKEYNTLLRRVAALARENDDITSAIYYYKQILNNYLEDDPQSKTNEIIYLCEIISTLYWEKGNYKQSEEYLKVVYFILSRPTASPSESSASLLSGGNKPDTPRFDNPIFFQFQLKLASLYLESYHFEKGLELLEFMKKHPLPHGKLNSLIFMLAKAYTKMEWFDECHTLLSQLENEDSPYIGSSTPSGGNFGISSITGMGGSTGGNGPTNASGMPFRALKTSNHRMGTGGGSGGNKTERNLKYWELECLNYYHANKFPEALICIECAIETCPASSLSSRGQYFYIRGKVFQKLVSFSNATLITFPTTLRPSSDEWKEIVDSCTVTTYNCTGDLIQECVASYKRSYHYFKSIGDDVKIQKAVSRIAETYLDRVFGPVALLHYQFDDVARLPYFPSSKLIQKDSEQEQVLSDLKKRKMKKDSLRGSSASDSSTSSTSSSAQQTLKEVYISYELIENPAVLALDINVDTVNILLLLRNYMNMAELKFLQGDRDLAISYWSECKNLYYTLFFDGPNLIIKSAPLQFIKRIFAICKRMVRFLFSFDQELINKNLMLIDSYLNLENDITQANQRPIQSNKPFSYESNPQIEKIFLPYSYKSLTIGRSFKKNRMEVSFSVGKGVNKLNEFATSPNSKAVNSSTGSTSSGGHRNSISLGSGASAASVSNLTFGEKTKDEEKSISNGDEVGEKIWGSFHSIKNEIRKYSMGKINQEELSTRNKGTIKQILKAMQSFKNHIANSIAHNGSTSPSSGSSSPPTLNNSNNSNSNNNNAATNSPGNMSPNLNYGSPSSLMSINNLGSLFRSQTKSNLASLTEGGRNRTPSNAGQATISRNQASKYEELSFNASSKINATLQKLVFSLQVDNYFIHYVPSSGRKRFNRIGGNEELTPLSPPSNILYLEVYLLSNANEKVSFAVSPLISLEKILLYLCNRPYWASSNIEDAGSKKKSFFGSFSRANQNSFRSAPKFIEKTHNFHNELMAFLASTLGPPAGTDDNADLVGAVHHPSSSNSSPINSTPHPPDSPPQERNHKDHHANDKDHHHHHGTPHHQHQNTHPHLPTPPSHLLSDVHGRSMSVGSSSAGRKIYTSQQLSLISLAKRMIKSEDPAYSKAYISIDQLSYQVCKVFSHREMRECSEQNPLQLFLFVNSGEERKSLSSFETNTKTNDQAITFSPEILSSITSLLSLTSKDGRDIQEEDARKKIVQDLQHTTFASLFEILPTDKEKIKQSTSSTNLQQKKTTSSKTFGFFGIGATSKPVVETPANLVPANISTTPLLFVCSKSLQIFPWELILPEFVVRYLSLLDILKTNYYNAAAESNMLGGIRVDEDCKSLPCFINCCYSQTDKSHTNDYVKKEFTVKSILHNLFTTPVQPSGNRVVNHNNPYHSALIKIGTKPAITKKKYKYLDFFDLSVSKPHHITNFIDQYNSSSNSSGIQYPITVFTYNDLVDLSQIPFILLKTKPICHVLFIPFSKQKEIMSRFYKIYDNQLKQNIKTSHSTSKKERYQFLISTIQTIKDEFYVPIVLFNPTFFVNNSDE
ncbi:hypothetical protein CYY_000666 [Polysphondylium violaceum]|uniref:Uncharacterized protein n=1 Tax=Polysphondylium violaceum TaxID=133409 RepID=A0A8J4V5C6_9MYCE|nr:hypothetical protein CYY_000666 [Polysphondylium violaceum]